MTAKYPYRLDKEPLGRGGFGVVHRGTHRVTGEVIAFKKALPGAAAELRIRREIEVQSQLDHRHIMPILSADTSRRWFTMPLASGSLPDLVRPGSAPRLLLASILSDVASALQYAHHRKHIHRDVTPSNILRLEGDDPRWVLADWGLVQPPIGQATLPITLTGQVLGTRAFGPPELMTAPHGVGPEVDVYYIGSVASWALTGVEPAPGHIALPEPGHWHDLIVATTKEDGATRPQSMIEVLSWLHDIKAIESTDALARSESQVELFTIVHCRRCGSDVFGPRCDDCGLQTG